MRLPRRILPDRNGLENCRLRDPKHARIPALGILMRVRGRVLAREGLVTAFCGGKTGAGGAWKDVFVEFLKEFSREIGQRPDYLATHG